MQRVDIGETEGGEADQDAAETTAIVIYGITDSEEERLARVPPGAEHVVVIPNNHCDDRPGADDEGIDPAASTRPSAARRAADPLSEAAYFLDADSTPAEREYVRRAPTPRMVIDQDGAIELFL